MASQQIGTYAEANTLCMRVQVCDYCPEKNIKDFYCLNYLHGLFACPSHHELAKRDINAYYSKISLVKSEDFQKAFPELFGLVLTIPRTDGSKTEGGKFLPSNHLTENAFLTKKEDTWYIPVTWECPSKGNQQKSIRLKDLGLSGVSESAIQSFIDVLDAGFYKRDYDDHCIAVSNGHQKKYKWVDGISLGKIDGEFCRVLNMPIN
jgi:hypothetical protein